MIAPQALSLFGDRLRDQGGAILTPRTQLETHRLSTQAVRVRTLMADREWRTLRTIAAMIGASEAGVSARLRDLRKKQFGSYIVERRKCSEHLYEYRVTPSTLTPTT